MRKPSRQKLDIWSLVRPRGGGVLLSAGESAVVAWGAIVWFVEEREGE
jgi:hypothetical protein